MPAKGLSVSPKSAIRSRPFKLSQGLGCLLPGK
jgi:hypothetical protein